MADYVPLIDPKDLRIYRVPSAKAKLYRDNGWADPDNTPEPAAGAIKQELSGWYDNGKAVAFTFARGIPLATKALSATVDEATFQNLAAKAKIFDEAHPLLSKGVQIAGGLATIPIGGALLKGAGLAAGAVGGALGLGAEAAEAGILGGEAAAGVGEAAAGAGEAAGLGAETAVGEGAGQTLSEEEFARLAQERETAVNQAANTRTQVQDEHFRRSLREDITAEERASHAQLSAEGLGRDGANAQAAAAEFDAANPAFAEANAARTSQAAQEAEAAQAAREAARRGSGVEIGEEAAGLGSEAAGAGGGFGGAGGVPPTSGVPPSGGVDLASLLTKTAGARKLGKIAAIGAGQNAAFGAAYRIDNQALEHALDPQGQEKLTFEANDVLLDAALGAAVPIGFSGLGKALGKTGKALKDKSITMFRGAVLKGDMLDAMLSQGREGSAIRMLDSQMGKGEGEIARNLVMNQKKAEQGMNVIKARYEGKGSLRVSLSEEQKQQILSEVERVTGTKQDPIYQEIEKGLFAQQKKVARRIDITALQALTKKIDKGPNIVWDDAEFARNPRNLIGRDARDVLASWQRKLIRDNGFTGAEDAIQWERLNQQSSDAQLILNGLASRRGMGVDDLFAKLGMSAVSGAALGATGLAGNAGVIGAAAQTAGWQAVRHVRIKHVAPFVNKLGKTLLATDQKIANVLDAGLRGVPGQVHKLYTDPDYDSTAAAVSLAGQDTAKTIGNLQTHLNENGIPQELSIGIAQAQAAGLAHLAQGIPKRNDAVDVSTKDTGDPVQQHRWLGQVKTFQDPTFGLAHPTADNLRILKQFYPQTLFSAQQALYNQIANNPNLPSEGRAWASRILERPLSNLDSPTFAQTLRQARQASQSAPPQGGAPRSGGTQNAVESSLTRADQLQNR